RPRPWPTGPTRSPTGRCSTRSSTRHRVPRGSRCTTAAAWGSAGRSTPARSPSPTARRSPRPRSRGGSATRRARATPGTSTPGAPRGGGRRAEGRLRTSARLGDAPAPRGRGGSTGGYRRYAWTPTDATLREWFAGEAGARGLDLVVDRAGNQWAWWGDP